MSRMIVRGRCPGLVVQQRATYDTGPWATVVGPTRPGEVADTVDLDAQADLVPAHRTPTHAEQAEHAGQVGHARHHRPGCAQMIDVLTLCPGTVHDACVPWERFKVAQARHDPGSWRFVVRWKNAIWRVRLNRLSVEHHKIPHDFIDAHTRLFFHPEYRFVQH